MLISDVLQYNVENIKALEYYYKSCQALISMQLLLFTILLQLHEVQTRNENNIRCKFNYYQQ